MFVCGRGRVATLPALTLIHHLGNCIRLPLHKMAASVSKASHLTDDRIRSEKLLSGIKTPLNQRGRFSPLWTGAC
jgi:hypothetical protein